MSPSARQERSWPNDELAGVRVLVVDDNPDARELMETAASVPTDTSGLQAWLPKPHAPPEIYRRLCEVLKAA